MDGVFLGLAGLLLRISLGPRALMKSLKAALPALLAAMPALEKPRPTLLFSKEYYVQK